MKEKTSFFKQNPAKFSLRCYLYFWAALVGVLVLAILAGFESPAVTIASKLIAWTPTVVVLTMFKTLFPGQTRKDWVKSRFSAKVSVPLLAVNLLVFGVMAFGTFFVTEGLHSDKLSTILSPGNLVLTALSVLISGALGDELGWRGYLQPAIEERHGGDVIRSALIVGLIWSFWHTPLWFVTTGFPMNLLPIYIIAFVVANISTAVIIAVCYAHCRNLVIPIWIHFCFNYFINIIMAGFDLQAELTGMLLWLAVAFCLTAVAAVGFAVWHTRKQRSAAK